MKTLKIELRRLALFAAVLYVAWCLAVGHNVTMNLAFYGSLEGRTR